MVAFYLIKPGDVLWDCHRTKMGNTTMTRMGCWQVQVVSVDRDNHTAQCSWNGNAPRRYTERQIKALRRTKAKDAK